MKIFQRVNHAADRRLPPIWLLLFSTVLTATLFALSGISRAEEAAMQSTKTSDANSELVVEGERVEKIYYLKEGETHVFSDYAVQSSKSLFLPPGTYRVSFELQGGYWGCRNELLQLSPEVPARLQVGTPLKASISVERHGRILWLDCSVVDAQGRPYISPRRSQPMRFVVYQNDREIGSGTFEYG